MNDFIIDAPKAFVEILGHKMLEEMAASVRPQFADEDFVEPPIPRTAKAAQLTKNHASIWVVPIRRNGKKVLAFRLNTNEFVFPELTSRVFPCCR